METNELTEFEISIMRNVRNGADIYDYSTARGFRSIEKKAKNFISIVSPKTYKGDGTDRMPYFGVITTKDGNRFLDQIDAKSKNPLTSKELFFPKRKRNPLKKIVDRRYWRSTNHPISAKDSVTCILECGHTARFKGSQEPKSKAACFRCGEKERQEEYRNQETAK